MKVRKMEMRSKHRKRLRQNIPHRRGIANIPSSWIIHEYKTSRNGADMNIQELLGLRPVNLKTVDTKNMNINLVERWSRLFESQGLSHEEAEKQAKLTVASDQNSGNLTESLKRAGFTDDQVKYFLEGRGGDDNLTESAK